jgi:hypothetical protein
MLSINRFDSDGGTVVNGGNSDSRGGSNYDGESMYSSGNVIVIGDGSSSYVGSS